MRRFQLLEILQQTSSYYRAKITCIAYVLRNKSFRENSMGKIVDMLKLGLFKSVRIVLTYEYIFVLILDITYIYRVKSLGTNLISIECDGNSVLTNKQLCRQTWMEKGITI